jgi:hypothetical protein
VRLRRRRRRRRRRSVSASPVGSSVGPSVPEAAVAISGSCKQANRSLCELVTRAPPA